jgi:hypothetical protein
VRSVSFSRGVLGIQFPLVPADELGYLAGEGDIRAAD